MAKQAEEHEREEAEKRLIEEHMKEEIDHEGDSKQQQLEVEVPAKANNESLHFDMFADEAPIEVGFLKEMRKICAFCSFSRKRQQLRRKMLPRQR